MAVNKSFNGTTYSIPTTAGENGWTSLTNFLQALADYAGLKTTQTFTIRTATTTPVTVSATSDYCVNVALSVAGASAVTLPTGAQGQVFVVLDGSRNSATYNITVSGTGGQTINGSASYVMASNGQAAMFQFSGTEWKVLSEYLGASINATKIGAGSVSNTEFGYLDGVTSAIQTQLDAKAAASGGTLTSPTLITPALGTPASGTLTNCTGLPIVAGTTGTLTVARGGTGLTALGSANQVLKVNGAGTALVFDASGSGDVVGPASSTDNAIARFDSTTGKLIQNSGATVDDSNQVSAASFTATGGTAANNTMYVASNALRLRGGTSGLAFYNTSGTETFNMSDTGAATLGPASAIGTSTFAGASIVGKTNGTDVAVGHVGQVMSTTYTTDTAFNTTGTWGQDASLTLTPGVWLLFGTLTAKLNGATVQSIQLDVSSTNGGSLGLPDNYAEALPPNSSTNIQITVAGVYANVSSNTTYYLNRRASYTSGPANIPRHTGRLRAVRIA